MTMAWVMRGTTHGVGDERCNHGMGDKGHDMVQAMRDTTDSMGDRRCNQ